MPTCPVCRGTKKVRLLGMMSGDCETCDASGIVSKETLAKSKTDFIVPAPIEKLELPANHAQSVKDAAKEQMRQANVGFRATPIELKKDQPKDDGMTETQRIAIAKAAIKPRSDDMLSSQKIEPVIATTEAKPKQVQNDKATKQAKG